MKRRTAILHGSFWAVAQNALKLATGLVSVPLTLGYLGSERYGLWMTALSLNAFLSFLDMGLTPTLMNRKAEAHGRGDRDTFRKLSSAGAFVGAVLLALGALLALAALFLPWTRLLHIQDPQAAREAPGLVAVLVLLGSSGAALAVVENIYAARLEISRPRLYATAAALVSFGLLLVGVRLRAGLPLLALLTASTTVLYRVPLLARLLRREPDLLVPRLAELREMLRGLLPVSLLFVGIQASAVVMSSLPNVILARARTLADVADFSVANRVVSIPLSAVAAVLPVLWPAFTVAWVRGERAWLRKRLAQLLLATAAAVAAFTVFIAFFGPWLVALWTHGRAHVTAPLLVALGGWLAAQALVYWLSTFLHSITDFRFELVCYAGSAALMFALAVFGARAYGAVGLAAAMACALALGSLWPMAARVRTKLEEPR